MMSPFAMSGNAANDLGLGRELAVQAKESEDEKKKRLMREAQSLRSRNGALGPATQMLFGSPGGFSV